MAYRHATMMVQMIQRCFSQPLVSALLFYYVPLCATACLAEDRDKYFGGQHLTADSNATGFWGFGGSGGEPNDTTASTSGAGASPSAASNVTGGGSSTSAIRWLDGS